MAQLVRGEQESVSAAPSSSSSPPPLPQPEQDNFPNSSTLKETHPEDCGGDNTNVGHHKKPAWKKPLNRVVAAGPVMGDTVSWPALSEATKPPSKSTVDSPNPSSNESVSASQEPLISNATQNQKKNPNDTSNPNLTTTPKSPARQKSLKRGGGRTGPAQNGYIRAPTPPPPLPLPPPPPPLFPVFDMHHRAMVPPVPDYFHYNSTSWEHMPAGGFVPQSNSVNYQSLPRNSSRRGNFGGHHHKSNGSSRDQHRVWSSSHSSNARDVRAPQQIAPHWGFLGPPPPPPPPGSIPFIRPHSAGPFGYHMGFDMTRPFMYAPTPHPWSFNEMPFAAQAPPPPPLSSPVRDHTMSTSLVRQIDYYFCDDNLSKDDFLRSKMDGEGWVPISLIAGFPKVKQWTTNVELIFKSLKASSVVEVKPYEVRRREEWKKWVRTPNRFATSSGSQSTVPTPNWFANSSGSQSTAGSTEKTLPSSLLKVTLDEAAANESSSASEADSSTKAVPCTSTSEELAAHSNMDNGETANEEACSSQLQKLVV